MTNRALVIGSQMGALSGVQTDVNAICLALQPYGFATPKVLIGQDASRDGIIDAYEDMIAAHQADDAAVIYYSGHGGRALNPLKRKVESPEDLQFVVPTDFGAPGAGFRGIFAFEMSALLSRLTVAGRNVTVILDCCHAALMSRDPTALVPRALPGIWSEGVAERLAALAPQWSAMGPESNPYAVRLVAAEFDRSAWEGILPSGKQGGLMTAALVQALEEAGADAAMVTWNAIGTRVRELVVHQVAEQRPEVEGPSRRRLFQLAEAGDIGGVAFFHDHGRPALRAGRLLGAVAGTEYAVMPLGATVCDEKRAVAKAVVQTNEANIALVSLDPATAQVEDGALAFALRLPFGKRRVALDGAIASAIIAGSKFVEGTDDPSEAIATLRARDNRLCVLDSAGAPLSVDISDDEAGRGAVNEILAGLARSDAIRLLPKGDLPGVLNVAWGRVEAGVRGPMQNGDTLHAGESLYVDVEYAGERMVYVGVLDLGIGGDVSLLSTSIPDGVPVAPGGRYCLGERDATLLGLKTSWNDQVPRKGVRRESLVVIAAEERTSFRALEGKVDLRSSKAGPLSPLDQLLNQLGVGAAREVAPEGATGGRFQTRHIEFLLSPDQRP